MLAGLCLRVWGLGFRVWGLGLFLLFFRLVNKIYALYYKSRVY